MKKKFQELELKLEDDVVHTTYVSSAIEITTKTKWYKRLWNIVSNPFYYIFCGKIKY